MQKKKQLKRTERKIEIKSDPNSSNQRNLQKGSHILISMEAKTTKCAEFKLCPIEYVHIGRVLLTSF